MNPSRWSFEIWTPGGLLTADFSGMTTNRRLVLTRNDSEDIQWRVDLNEVKRYARALGTTWQQIIQNGISEVRLRRGTKYMCGGKIISVNRDRSSQGDWLDIRARGFLDLFADRYTPGPLVQYTGMDRAAMAWDLINVSQSNGADWDFGITVGSLPTIGPYTVQLQNVRVKDQLIALSQLQTGLDFQFTHDKVFNVFTQIGTQRPDVVFSYPGNTNHLTVTGDATNMQNKIYLLGSGIGSIAVLSTEVDDYGSQKNYKVREKPLVLSNQLDSGSLADYGNAQLQAWGTPFDIPAVEYDGTVGPALDTYGIGDYVQVQELDDPDTDIFGFYRVEKIDISLDNNDSETIKVSFGR